MSESFYTPEELAGLGLAAYGEDVKISRHCVIYGADKITIGSHVRIDDFCYLSGAITLGSYIHISTYSALFSGAEGIVMEDFSCLSSRVSVYAHSNDYSGAMLTNPTVPSEYCGEYGGTVTLKKHVIVGTGSTILCGVTVGEGSAVGAMSLVTKDVAPWTICCGIPARPVKERKKDLLQYEEKMRADGLL